MRTLTIVFVALALAAGTACSKSDSDAGKGATNAIPTPAPPPPPVVPPSPAAPDPPKPAAKHVELQIASVANTMTFDKTSLTVPAGAEVHLVFKNNATSSVLEHNWALVKPGSEASVAAAGLKMGEQAGYVDVRDHDLLVNTDLTKPGATSDVTFTAPDEPGKYPYICTFPGHYMMMKGVLTVTP